VADILKGELFKYHVPLVNEQLVPKLSVGVAAPKVAPLQMGAGGASTTAPLEGCTVIVKVAGVPVQVKVPIL
jgi:hypothetical protein